MTDTTALPTSSSSASTVATVDARATVHDLAASTFDEAINGAGVPVVVDVWAPWCGPCSVVLPALQAIATEHRGDLEVFKLNADDHPEIPARFGVMGLPTLLVFDEGVLVKRIVGARGKGRLLEELADLLRARA